MRSGWLQRPRRSAGCWHRSSGSPLGLLLATAALFMLHTTASGSFGTTCDGALVNPVSAGSRRGADGWVPAEARGGEQPSGTLQWDSSLAHNGSAGSLQIRGGPGAWSTNMTAALAGKLIRLAFFRRTTSASNSLSVTATLDGVEADPAGAVGRVSVARRVSSMPAGWQRMALGDFQVPATSDGSVSLAIDFSARATNTSWEAASLNLASFSCEIIEPSAAAVRAPLVKVAAAAAAGSAGASRCSAWRAHPSARVYNGSVPPAAEEEEQLEEDRIEPVHLYAGRNERVAFQVVLEGPCAASARSDSWRWSSFEAGSSSSTGTLISVASTAMSVREVADMELTIATPPYGRIGLTPEYLVTADQAATDHHHSDHGSDAVNRASTRTFWFKLTVPVDASAGNATTTVSLQGQSGGTLLSFAVVLEVGPSAIAIPVQPSIDIYGNIWQHTGPADADDATIASYYRNLWDHRVFTGPDMNELHAQLNPGDDTVNVSSAGYERELAYILAHSPFRGRTVGSTGGQWLKINGITLPGHHGVDPNASWLGIPMFTDATHAVLTARYKKASSSYLTQCFAVLKKHGAGDRGLIKFFDEPTMEPGTVNALRAVATHIRAVARAAGVKVRLRVSGGVPTPELVAAYSPGIWDMHSDAFEWYKPLYPAARDAGMQITLYNNGVNLLSQPLLRTRTFFWALFQQGLSGALCWWSVSDWKRSGANFAGMFREDMGFNQTLIYGQSGVLLLPPVPGSGVAAGAPPLDTLQWEQTLLGLQDYELLHALRAALGRAEARMLLPSAATDELPSMVDAVAVARAVLADVSLVTQGLSAVRPTNDITYTVDVAVLERVRRQVQDALSRLSEAPMG